MIFSWPVLLLWLPLFLHAVGGGSATEEKTCEQVSGACPPCPFAPEEVIDHDIASLYWQQQYQGAIGCICSLKGGKRKKRFPAWVSTFLNEEQDGDYYNSNNTTNYRHTIPTLLNGALNKSVGGKTEKEDYVKLSKWEILGPLPVGKLELDGDPIFSVLSRHLHDFDNVDIDVAAYILSLRHAHGLPIYTEHVSSGAVSWQTMTAKQGTVDVTFPYMDWNTLVQSLSILEVQEFQGWARSTSTVAEAAGYVVHCSGVHSVYIRQQNTTQCVVGDIYQGGWMRGVVQLQKGVVGIVVPLRGVGRVNFKCFFEKVESGADAHTLDVSNHRQRTIDVLQVNSIPNLLQVDLHKPQGLLLTSIFGVLLSNVHNDSVLLNVKIKKVTPALPDGKTLSVRVLNSLSTDGSSSFAIQSGLTVALPLELVLSTPTSDHDEVDESLFLPCSTEVQVLVQPSVGFMRVFPILLSCRQQTQSLLLSYLDHDHSVVQAAVILPQSYQLKVEYPVLLTLHGTGISPSNQADAYKYKPPKRRRDRETGLQEEYIFGVAGYWLVAPSRHGAHNWEGIGGLTALHVVSVLHQIAQQFAAWIPAVSLVNGVMAGHSMGGHGAWLAAMNAPDRFVCLSPASGWIRKEEYHSSNSFFQVDVSNSFVDVKLKMLLEMSMSEFHVDRQLPNLNSIRTHIRVGAKDVTTHPWYSRRMHRLLEHHRLESTFEEVRGKEHWWWDTAAENDGGVLNDEIMRHFFNKCLTANDELKRIDDKEGNEYGRCAQYNATRPLRLAVLNVGMHEGHCGVRIFQQFKSMHLSKISAYCEGKSFVNKTCWITSGGNVRNLYLRILPTHTASDGMTSGNSAIGDPFPLLFGAVTLVVDNVVQPLQLPSPSFLHLCWDTITKVPSECKGTETERGGDCPKEDAVVPLLTGPIRMVYAKPFCIVYGTQTDDELLARHMFQSAAYLANANVAAHLTFAPLMSDVDYLAAVATGQHKVNAIFIGGAMVNMAMRDQQKQRLHGQASLSHSRVVFTPDGGFVLDEQFAFDNQSKRAAIIFTLPLLQPDVEVLGVCIHAAVPSDYLHVTRLMWPTIPPMVRAPFANYMPDYLVFRPHALWSEGFGAVFIGGFWGPEWKFDREQAYVHNE